MICQTLDLENIEMGVYLIYEANLIKMLKKLKKLDDEVIQHTNVCEPAAHDICAALQASPEAKAHAQELFRMLMAVRAGCCWC